LHFGLTFVRIPHAVIEDKQILEAMAKAGVHFGVPRSRRHPSTKSFVFGTKNDIEIIDLEKTFESLKKAQEFVTELGRLGKKILMVGNKSEAREIIKVAAERSGQPYVNLRWIGGTLTNFDQIRKRIDRLATLKEEGKTGGLEKYTKRERGHLSHEVKNLERFFSGIVNMVALPDAMIVVDSSKEEIAVVEAHKLHIPVIALCNSDCDIRLVEYPIVGNDKSAPGIKLIIEELMKAYSRSA